MSSNKLRKFTSFRHRRENEEENSKTGPVVRRQRRKSFTDLEDEVPPKSDFLGALRKLLEDKRKRGVMEKRKSMSTDNVALGRMVPPTGVVKMGSISRFKSVGNLEDIKGPMIVELKKTLALRTPKRDTTPIVESVVSLQLVPTPPVEMATAARDVDFASVIDWLTEIRYRTDEGSAPWPRSPTVIVQPPEEEEEVPLRRVSSHQLRQDPAKSKTCFLYPGPRSQRSSEAVVVRQGPLERVKVSSSGRRLPRNWSRRKNAMLVSDGRLMLSEDANQAVDSIKGETIDVGGARVVKGSTHTTKKNVIEIIGSDGRLTLLQNDDGPTTDGWFEALVRTAGPPKGGSLPRAKSMRSPTPHDITALTAQDSTVRSALGRFFSGGRRPTREALEKSGIYRDEPVFGSRLDSLCAGPNGAPPQFVRECTRALGEPPHVSQVGLYRTSGNLSHIQRLRLRVDQNDQKAIAEEQDSDVLAGALKLFFRELREPLIPYTAYVKLLEEVKFGTEKVRRLVIKLLPASHVTTLAALCRHLAHVCSFEQKNQMNPQSMAIVWGPSLTWPDDATQDAMLACTRVNRLIEYLIQNERAIF